MKHRLSHIWIEVEGKTCNSKTNFKCKLKKKKKYEK